MSFTRTILTFLVLSLTFQCGGEGTESERASQAESINCFPVEVEGGWGYEIYVGGKKYIHQPYLPAVGGKQPFANKAEALAVGNFVRSKLLRGITPPSVTTAQVDSLLKTAKKQDDL